MIRCIAIDDEPAALQQIALYVKELPQIELIGTSTNPIQGLEMIKQTKPDALFLDMEMDAMNGTEVMRNLPFEVNVIVCTAYSEFAVESIELDVVDYLLKPLETDRFTKAVERLRSRILQQSLPLPTVKNDYLFVQYQHKGKLKKLEHCDIVYVEAKKNDMIFWLHDDFLISNMSMKEVEAKLTPADGFIRIHRSYVVSIKMIDMVDEGMVKLKNGKSLVIGGAYRSYFLKNIY